MLLYNCTVVQLNVEMVDLLYYPQKDSVFTAEEDLLFALQVTRELDSVSETTQ